MKVIYIIKCLSSKKVYIGKDTNYPKRIYAHFYNLKMNKHVNKHFQRLYNKYSRDSFFHEILEEFPLDVEKKVIDEKERYYIKLYKENKTSINLTEGGDGGKIYGKHPRLKIIYQYELDGKYIRKWEGARTICSKLGFNWSKINASCRGTRKQAYGYQWFYIYKGRFVKSVFTYEHKDCRKVEVKDKNGNKLGTFESIRHAIKTLNISKANFGNIFTCARGERPYAHNYNWKYLKN